MEKAKMTEYNHIEIERKWRKKWEKNKTFKVEDNVEGKENEYILAEFPYPSGNLHVGHWYAFGGTDIYARYRRMQGKNVLFPIGFDSFGLPAENAAIKRNLDPRDWTYGNIETMTEQLKSMGAIFDWDRKIATSDPEYYMWTQKIFIMMFEKGLAYKKESLVNWDPIDKTILANEQVLADGTAERSGAKVEKKEMEQWFIKITDYAERLNDDLEELDWPTDVKTQQKNWIGKSFGSEISFPITGSDKIIKVFTTRPDTLFGATYVVLAPESDLINKLGDSIENLDVVLDYVKESKNKKDMDRIKNAKSKTGVKLEGITAINPVNKEKIPVFVADYVLGDYGTGAVMAVPAHDDRDMEFAKHFNLEIRGVIKGGDISEQAFTEHGELMNSGDFDGLNTAEAKEKITEFVSGEMKTTYRLRDWSVGRQRYWGCPVPIVYDPEGNPHSVPAEHLPWKLPNDVDHAPTGESPLAKSKELKERTEKIFGDGWTPEVETLDTFLDSSWYFLRYLDPENKNELVSKEIAEKWMPVEFYSGGAEQTTLHLLYSRFFNKFLFDEGISPVNEPFKKRLNRSLILGTDGTKMSKSKGNVVDPDEIIERLGADTVRAYLAFIGPYNEANSYPWDANGVVGVRRFLEKVWRISEKSIENNQETSNEVKKEFHKIIKRVGEEFSQLKFNAGIAQLMSFANLVDKEGIGIREMKDYIKILSPVAPYISEEIGEKLDFALHNDKNIDFISNMIWPKYDSELIVDNIIKVAVQVNGKIRAQLEVSPEITENDISELALSLESTKKWLEGKEVKKVIYIKGKILSIVAI
jgi:leucyl-tRNA synthetase